MLCFGLYPPSGRRDWTERPHLVGGQEVNNSLVEELRLNLSKTIVDELVSFSATVRYSA